MDPTIRPRQIANAIRFKQYLLTRDLESRRVVLDFFIETIESPEIRTWFQLYRAITDASPTERKEQNKADANWVEFLTVHSTNPQLQYLMDEFH